MKILILSLAVVATLSLSACGKAPSSAQPSALAQAMAQPASVQTPSQAAAPATQPGVPADDPAALAAIVKAVNAAANATSADSDGNDGEMDDPVSGDPVTMGISGKRADGYPPYAITCDMASRQCTELNGMGNPIQIPITDLRSLTLVRNADVLSDAYICAHGICTDPKGNLVGKISPAMLALHPNLK